MTQRKALSLSMSLASYRSQQLKNDPMRKIHTVVHRETTLEEVDKIKQASTVWAD